MWIYLAYIFYAHIILLSFVILKRAKKPFAFMIGNILLTLFLVIFPLFVEKSAHFGEWISISSLSFLVFFVLLSSHLKKHERTKRTASLCKRGLWDSFKLQGKIQWEMIILGVVQLILWGAIPLSHYFVSLKGTGIFQIWIFVSVVFIATLFYAWYSATRLKRVIYLQFPTILTFSYMVVANAFPSLTLGADMKLMSALWIGVFGTTMLVSILYMIREP